MSKFQIYSDRVTSRLEAKGKSHSVYRHQLDAVFNTKRMLSNDLQKWAKEGKSTDKEVFRPMAIISPTGSGKSGMIAMLPYVLSARKVLILTPSIVISEQIYKALGKGLRSASFLEKTGVVTESDAEKMLEPVKIIDGRADMDDRLTNLMIVNAQKFGGKSGTSLSLHYQDREVVKDVRMFFAQFDLLIVDEAHYYPAATWKNIVDTFSIPVEGMVKKLVFLTATPFRKGTGGKEVPILEDLLERTAYTIPTTQLQNGGFIRKTTFEEKDDPATLLEDILCHFKRQEKQNLAFKPQGMIIVRTIKEAKACEHLLNSRIEEDDLNGGQQFSVAIHKSMGTYKAKKLLDDFTTGRYRVAIICESHREGYDNANVTLCVILRNIGSRRVFTQFVGRCMRVNRAGNGIDSSSSNFKRIGVDKTEALVISYKNFGQQKMWDEREQLAEVDPTDNDFNDGKLKCKKESGSALSTICMNQVKQEVKGNLPDPEAFFRFSTVAKSFCLDKVKVKAEPMDVDD